MTVDWTDPTAVALLAARALETHSLPYALYGGLMLAAYGEPRETRDADLAVARLPAEQAREAFASAGLTAAVAFADTPFGGLRISRLALLRAPDSSGINTIDLVEPRSARYAEAVLSRSLRAPLRGAEIAVVAPEDFVLLKALSTRDRDLDDAAGVLKRTSADLDFDLLAREATQLAADLPDWEVLRRLDEIRRRSQA